MDTNELHIADAFAVETPAEVYNLRSELTLGLALPFRAKPARSREPETSEVQNVAPDGSYGIVKLTTVSEYGALSALDFDVTTVLTTFAYLAITDPDRQERYFRVLPHLRGRLVVFFHLSDICKELGLNPANMTTKVKESVVRIKSQSLLERTFGFSAKSKEVLNDEVRYEILTDFGYCRRGQSDKDAGDYRSIFYVVFHPKVEKQILEDMMSILDRKNYLKLKSGIERRIYLQLRSKQRLFGNRYAMNLDEIATAVGFQQKTSYKKREDIKRHLDQIAEITNELKFVITKQPRSDKYIVYVEHLVEQNLIESKFRDSFYQAICDFYGEDNLQKIGFLEQDLENLRNELKGKFLAKTGNPGFSYNKQEIDPIEFAVDISLFQVLIVKYQLKNPLKNFIRFMFDKICEEKIDYPAGYRFFVVKRNNDIKAEAEKAKIAREIAKTTQLEKQKEENINKGFEIFWKDTLDNNHTYMSAIRAKAHDLLTKEDPEFAGLMDNIKKMVVDTRAKSITRELFLGGEISRAMEEIKKGFKKLSVDEKAGFIPRIESGQEQILLA